MEILKENIEKGYLVAKVDATDKFGVLREMGNVLVEKGWVKDTYQGQSLNEKKYSRQAFRWKLWEWLFHIQMLFMLIRKLCSVAFLTNLWTLWLWEMMKQLYPLK